MGDVVNLDVNQPLDPSKIVTMGLADGLSVHLPVSPEAMCRLDVIRVPGGWVYTVVDLDEDGSPMTRAATFVPWTAWREDEAALSKGGVNG